MGSGEDVGELGPARRGVEGGVGRVAGGDAGGEGEEAGGLLGLLGVGVPVGDEVLLGVGNSLEKLGLGLGADELNVLLEAEEEFEFALGHVSRVRHGYGLSWVLAHLHLSQFLFILGAPRQRLGDTPPQQRLADAAHALKRLEVDQGLHVALLGELLGGAVVAVAQEVVGEQAVEAAAAPGLVLDVLGGADGVEVVEVDDAGGRLGVQAGLLGGEGVELAADAAHAGEHGVEAAQGVVLGGAARGGGRGGVAEQRLEGRGVLFDGEVGGAKVFAEELVGEAEEGLVLGC